MNMRNPPLESRKLRKAAHGKPCVRCHTHFEGNSGRHYCGLRQHLYGKGRGQKCHDFLIADLCPQCDSELNEGSARKSVEHSEEFLHCCMLTLIRRHAEGVLEVK